MATSLLNALIRPRDLTNPRIQPNIFGMAKLVARGVPRVALGHDRQESVLSLHSPEAVQKQLGKDNVFIAKVDAIIGPQTLGVLK